MECLHQRNLHNHRSHHTCKTVEYSDHHRIWNPRLHMLWTKQRQFNQILGLYSLRRHRHFVIGIPIINLRRSSAHLRFLMGTPIPVSGVFSEMRPTTEFNCVLKFCNVSKSSRLSLLMSFVFKDSCSIPFSWSNHQKVAHMLWLSWLWAAKPLYRSITINSKRNRQR